MSPLQIAAKASSQQNRPSISGGQTYHDPHRLYEKVVATINPRGEAGQEPRDPVVMDLPATWDAIKPGHLVLYHESLVDGWWEGIVINRTGDKLTLRVRDYPGYPKFTVPVTAVALVNPTNS
jgi:hypothetical protein